MARISSRSSVLSTQKRNRMRATTFAFTKKRKEPLNDARHVRNAVARFDQVQGVTAKEREAAWRRPGRGPQVWSRDPRAWLATAHEGRQDRPGTPSLALARMSGWLAPPAH